MDDLGCFSLPPSQDSMVSLSAVKAPNAIKFCINLCKAGFNQHSLASPAKHSFLYQDGKKKKERSKQLQPSTWSS